MVNLFKKGLQWWDWTALVLLILGGLHYLILGIFDANLIYRLFGVGVLARIVFTLIGVSAVFSMITLWKFNK